MKMRSSLIAALVVGLALPAFAQDGFRVGVQLGSMKTTGDTTAMGYQQVSTPPNVALNTFNYDQATQTPWALDLAWVKGDDELSLTYLTSKKSNSRSFFDATNMYRSGLVIGIGGNGMDGSQELKAQIIDLTWKRVFVKGNDGSLAFSSGLRYSSISDEFTTTFSDATHTPTAAFHAKGKGTGFGLAAGLHGRMNFNDRMWMTSGFTAAMVSTSVSTDDYHVSQFPGPGVVTFTSEDRRQSLLQTEAYLRFNMNFVKTFNGYLGYEVKNYGNDAATIQNAYTDLGLPTTHGFGLSGFTLGLSYTF